MKKFTFFIIVMLILSSFESFTQYDARQIPIYLRYDYNPPKIIHGKARAIIKGDMHVDVPKFELPDNMLSEDGFRIVNVSGTQGAQDETWIAYNPTNPLNIIGSSNNTRFNHAGVGYKMAAYYTTDGGNTWAQSTTPSNMDVYVSKPTTGGMTNFDPGLAFDTKGNAYYSYGFTQITNGDDTGDNGLFVNKSTDGGKTWGEPIPVAIELAGTGTQPFHDRYSIASDINPNSPYKDRLYLAWQRFRVNPGVAFAYSTDGNESWSPVALLPGSGNGTQAPMPAVGPNGEVYVAWRQYKPNQTTDLVFNRSLDGGKTWLTQSKTILNIGNLGTINSESGRNVLPDKQSIRVSSCAYIAVDRSNGPRKGWIYVVTAGKLQGVTRIVLVHSTDGGNSWSGPKVIDENDNGTDVFFPSITVDPVTGMISIFYYSSQNDPNNIGVDGYLAVSFNGTDFKNFRLTPQTWYLNSQQSISWQGTGNFYWGDYSSITSYNATVYPLFWMPSNPNGNYYSNTSYVAIVSALPSPPSNVTFINSMEMPSKVEIKWVDPTKNKLGGDLDNFTISVYKGSEKIADVAKGVQTYTDNSAVEGEVFSYSLRTRTDDGLESELVSISGIAGGSPEPKTPTNIRTRIADNGILVMWDTPSEHIDGSDLNDLARIDFYANGNKVAEASVPEIQAGTSGSKIIELPAGKFYDIHLVAVGSRNNKETESKPTEIVFNYAGAPINDFQDNFDDAESLIPTYVVGQPQWGITDKASKSGQYSLTDSPNSDYPSRANHYIIFAPTVIAIDRPTLSWEHIALIESGDYGLVSVSTDLENWDDIASFDVNSSSEWDGTLAGSKWVSAHRSLAKYIGDTVYIRFLLNSNFIKNNDGWYIDDLRLDADGTSVDEFNKIVESVNIKISPNPVSDILELELSNSYSGNLSIDIVNALGMIVKSSDVGYSPAGKFVSQIDVNELPAGAYAIRVRIDGMIKTQSFIICK